jgi:hypothetical protein
MSVREMLIELRAVKPPRASQAGLQTNYRVQIQLA